MRKFLLLTFAVLCAVQPALANDFGNVFGIVGDGGSDTANQQQVKTSLARAGVDALILPGDNLYNPLRSYGSIWDPWRKSGFNFPVVAIGNHNSGYEREMRYFEMPAECYSRTIGNARFVVLNSDNRLTVREQIRFLDSELTSATEPLVFVVYHHPTFTVSERHDWEERLEFQNGVRAALLRHGQKITALIVGHDHIATLLDINGIPMIVSGAVHESIPTVPRAFRDGPFTVQTKWLFQDGPFWTRLELDEKTNEVVIDFVDAARNLSACKARLHPRPIAMSPACGKTTSRERPLRTAPRNLRIK